MNQKTKDYLKLAINNKVWGLYNEIKETKYRKLLNEKSKNKKFKEGNVCILLDKGMGDFLLFAYYFEKIVEYYRGIGKNVYVLCSSYNVKFLEFCHFDLPYIILIEINDNNNYIYPELTEQYMNFFEMLILPFDIISKFHFNLIRQLKAKQIFSIGNKTCSFRDISLSDKKLLPKINVFEGTSNGFYAERHKILTEKLTGRTYDLGLIQIKKERPIIDFDYYIINIGASSNAKVWPLENVIDLINMLKKKIMALPIIIGNANSDVIEKLQRQGINCDFINLMDINKTVSLCGNARFVVTNDTGIYHISVCLGVRTYVIAAGWYMEQFLPYPDQLIQNGVSYIVADKRCNTCNRHLTCFFHTKKGKTVECLANIPPQIVFDYLKDEYSNDRN